ncbi:acylphosphatase [Candidatus Omnitrophota bacterium]
MADKRVHVFYSGHVQGVGFRYTAHSIASRLGLCGWAKNLRDGRVEVVCEGEEKKLKMFLDSMVNEFPEHYIMDADVAWKEPTREFNGFSISF